MEALGNPKLLRERETKPYTKLYCTGLNIITYTILVAPDYNYNIRGLKTLF